MLVNGFSVSLRFATHPDFNVISCDEFPEAFLIDLEITREARGGVLPCIFNSFVFQVTVLYL